MDRFDLRAEVIGALRITKAAKLNERSNPMRFNCVRERHSSHGQAWLGDGAWGCYACGVTEPLETLARELGIEVQKTNGFDVEEYAKRKHFTLTLLEAWGVKTIDGKFGPIVAIPYRDASGGHLRTKCRHRKGTFWLDDGKGSHLYGLDKLAEYPNEPVLLVEGESDCHAAWHHKVLAVGLPGAGNWKSEWAPLLANRDVYVWQEPGDAAAAMIRKLAPDIPHARIIDNDGVKDVADLHRDVGAGFKPAIAERMAKAYPIDRLPPVVRFDPLVGATLDRLKARKLAPIDAVPTMLPTWNSHCRDAGGGVGLARSWHITVGAKSGRGKSLIALNLGAAAVRAGERVAFISLEMSQEQLGTRYLAVLSGCSISEMEQGRLFSSATWSTAAKIANDIYGQSGAAMYVNDGEISKLDDIVTCMEYEHEVHGCRYMILDYLQLARATASGRSENEILHQMTLVSGAVRRTARKLNVVSVALSQFNRATSANNEHPPTPEGLMGGSPIENDSDQVILLDHSQYERINDHGNVYALAPLILAKNRHGSMTEIPIKMDFRCLRITEVQVAGSGLDADGPTPMAYELRRDEPHPADCEPEYGEVYEPADVAPGALDFFAGRS